MALHFEKIRVKEVKKETANCVSISFQIPADLTSQFRYEPGQYLTVRTFINGQDVRRSYSLCSSPLQNDWRIAVKKVDGGVFSAFANDQLQAGDTLDVMPPLGKFTPALNSTNHKHYIGIAAGSGITPVISIIKTILATEPNSTFTLVFGNKNRHSIIFRDELEALKNKYIHRFGIIHILSREMTDAAINHGRINAEKCAALFEKALNIKADEFFICGPEEMTMDIKRFLQERGIGDEKIRVELFTTGNEKHRTKQEKVSVDDGPKSKITIKQDGITFSFDLAFDEEAILDAALHHGLDVPYSCKGGVCCTCKAKLIEGEVDMEVCYGLEPEEIEKGYILACQSHPKTSKVVIDFDVK